MNRRKMRYIILVICLAVAPPATLLGQMAHNVKLSRHILSDTSKYHGSKVLTFAEPVAGSVTVPTQWTAVETAVIVDNPQLQPVVIVRFKNYQGKVNYAVADDGSAVFDSASVLHFHPSGDKQIADFTFTVRPKGNTDANGKHLAYKVFLSNNRVIARLGECREGILQLGKRDYDIRIYAPSINNPFFAVSSDAVCLIDMNRDGTYSWRWQLDESTGNVIASERVALTKPFSVDGQKLKAVSIDSAGTVFTCSDYSGDTAAVVGFMAPGFSVADLAGNTHTLADMKGHIILITFWAAKCGYCERIRPRLDTLVSHSDPAQFRAISATVDSDSSAIEKFLRDRPYGGIVVPYTAPLWKMYNSRKTTPVYYIIDRDGSVVFSGTGASAFSIVERIVADKLPSGK